MSKASEIPDALLDRLTSLSVGSPALPIAFPDIEFDPATDAPAGSYIEAVFFRNVAKWKGLASGVVDQGVLVVSVIRPKGQGVIGINEDAQEVADHFARLTLTSGATRVKTFEPDIGSPMPEGDKTIVAVTIPWTA